MKVVYTCRVLAIVTQIDHYTRTDLCCVVALDMGQRHFRLPFAFSIILDVTIIGSVLLYRSRASPPDHRKYICEFNEKNVPVP